MLVLKAANRNFVGVSSSGKQTRLGFRLLACGRPEWASWLLRAEGVWPGRAMDGLGKTLLRILPAGLEELSIPEEKLSGPR